MIAKKRPVPVMSVKDAARKNKKNALATVINKPVIKMTEVELSDEWMDAQDMKQLFKVSSNTLGNWRKWGYIKASKVGRNYYYNKALVRALLENNMR